MHEFLFSAISEGNFCRARFRSSKSGWRHQSDRNDPKGQGTLCGQCRHCVHARIPCAFKCWWPPSSAQWFTVSSSTSLHACSEVDEETENHWAELDHGSMVCALTTHQIWTNGYCAHRRLRAYAWWLHTCILQVMCIEPSAGCLSCEHSFPPLQCVQGADIMMITVIDQNVVFFFNLRVFIKE